jgi:hypothetical protein
VLGWLALVLVAFMIGHAAGMVPLKSSEVGNGQSRLADQTLAQQFPRQRASETVLLESRAGMLASSDYRAAVAELVARLSRTPSVSAIKSPLAPGNQGQVAKNGRAALLSFQLTGDPDTAKDRVGPALAATAAVQAAHPSLFIGEFGLASANKAIDKRTTQDFQRAEATSLPVTLFILVLAFGALVAVGVPLLLGTSRAGFHGCPASPPRRRWSRSLTPLWAQTCKPPPLSHVRPRPIADPPRSMTSPSVSRPHHRSTRTHGRGGQAGESRRSWRAASSRSWRRARLLAAPTDSGCTRRSAAVAT